MAKAIPLNERIIFALDVDRSETALDWVKRLEPRIGFFKVGLQLFLAGGFEVIDRIAERGHKVMVDLKLFDIPETVSLAVRELSRHPITFATVHGNDPILRAALAARAQTKILAVTVLTSFGEEDLRAMGLTGSIEELVYFRAKRALELGCDGVVSSGLEARRLRADLGDQLLIVTPGIRPGGNVTVPQDDQRRIVTARQAILDGADHVVVGRPIRGAEDPLGVVAGMQAEIEQALTAPAS